MVMADPNQRGLIVLIVEDEFMVRRSIAEYFKTRAASLSKRRLASALLPCAIREYRSTWCSPTSV
jgi:hypothetical protein